MTYKPSKLGWTDWVFGWRLEFISKCLHVWLNVPESRWSNGKKILQCDQTNFYASWSQLFGHNSPMCGPTTLMQSYISITMGIPCTYSVAFPRKWHKIKVSLDALKKTFFKSTRNWKTTRHCWSCKAQSRKRLRSAVTAVNKIQRL